MKPRLQLYTVHAVARDADVVCAATTALLSVVASGDGQSWQVQLSWDNGRLDRILCRDSGQAAEDWINMIQDRDPKPG
jgi:hypothetical protein